MRSLHAAKAFVERRVAEGLWVSRSLLEAVAHGGNPQDRAASLYVARAIACEAGSEGRANAQIVVFDDFAASLRAPLCCYETETAESALNRIFNISNFKSYFSGYT